jgi:hypothetical protein
MKSRAVKPATTKEIPCPSKFTNLQHAMGLADNKKLYTRCRVSLYLKQYMHSPYLMTNKKSTVRDVVGHAGLPLHLDWRRQDPVTIGKVAELVCVDANLFINHF